jgi:hypothetical protein
MTNECECEFTGPRECDYCRALGDDETQRLRAENARLTAVVDAARAYRAVCGAIDAELGELGELGELAREGCWVLDRGCREPTRRAALAALDAALAALPAVST